MKIKTLTFSIVLATCAISAHAQQPKLTELPLDNTDTVTLMAETLNQIYGSDSYWRKHQCWVTEEDQAALLTKPEEGAEAIKFCMKPLAVHVLMSDSGPERIFIQTTGYQANPESIMNSDTKRNDYDDFVMGHSSSGAFGAFILDPQNNRLISSNYASLYPMGYGSGPGEALQPVQISEQGDYAWLGEGGFVYQGIASTIPVLYTQQGEKIKDIAGNIPGVQEEMQEYEYTYAVDSSKTENGYYAMQITEKNPEGKTRTFEAKYDPAKGSYQCSDKVCMQ